MAGEKVRSVAAVLEVSVASVVKWSQLFRRTGSVALGPMHGHRPGLLLAHRDSLLARTANDQPFTLRGLRAELAERCVVVDDQTVWTFVHAEGLSFKKSVLPREQDRPDIARKRAFWKKHQACVDPRRLVFIDETWTKTNMAPLRGWAPRGLRLDAKVPYGHWKTMTFVAALRWDAL